jgi:hypothetical protein
MIVLALKLGPTSKKGHSWRTATLSDGMPLRTACPSELVAAGYAAIQRDHRTGEIGAGA